MSFLVMSRPPLVCPRVPSVYRPKPFATRETVRRHFSPLFWGGSPPLVKRKQSLAPSAQAGHLIDVITTQEPMPGHLPNTTAEYIPVDGLRVLGLSPRSAPKLRPADGPNAPAVSRLRTDAHHLLARMAPTFRKPGPYARTALHSPADCRGGPRPARRSEPDPCSVQLRWRRCRASP